MRHLFFTQYQLGPQLCVNKVLDDFWQKDWQFNEKEALKDRKK